MTFDEIKEKINKAQSVMSEENNAWGKVVERTNREVSEFQTTIDSFETVQGDAKRRLESVVDGLQDLLGSITAKKDLSDEGYSTVQDWFESYNENLNQFESSLEDLIPEFIVEEESYRESISNFEQELSENSESLSGSFTASFTECHEHVHNNIVSAQDLVKNAIYNFETAIDSSMEIIKSELEMSRTASEDSVQIDDQMIREHAGKIESAVMDSLNDFSNQLINGFTGKYDEIITTMDKLDRSYNNLAETIHIVQRLMEMSGVGMRAGSDTLSSVTDSLNSVA